MNVMLRIVALVLLFACLAARADDQAGAAQIVFTGKPYTGKVVARVREPGSARDKSSHAGSGSARFVDIGNGRSRLVVSGKVRQSANLAFTIEGAASESGWSGRSGGLQLAIGNDGTISGGGVEQQHRLRFGGKATADRFDLRVELELLEPAEGRPAATTIAFDYGLGRPAATKSSPLASTKPDRRCKRTVWQTRNVTTPLGGMQMIRVARCAD